MKGKRTKKSDNKISKIVRIILLIFFVSIMIFSGIKIILWIKENIERNKIIQDLQDTISIDENIDNANKYNIDFNRLKEKNNDTVAWFKINGTDIEYPVVKTTNNDFYLTHSFDKSYNSSGWAFMDYKNKCDGTDKNMIIYGHNRRDGGMFATLKNILTDEWQNNEDNFTIPFITENTKEEYKVFSVYKIEKEDFYITTNFNNDTEFEDFINKIKSRSDKNFGLEVTKNDKLLTVSTCADDNNYRIVLHAKKIN